MNTNNIYVGNLKRIIEVYQMSEEEIKSELDKKITLESKNCSYVFFDTGYSLETISNSQYFYKIPYGKYKNGFVSFNQIKSIFDLIKVCFSLFDDNSFLVYYEPNLNGNLQKTGDILFDNQGQLFYYPTGYGCPSKSISFGKVKKLVKSEEVSNRVSGRL